LDCQVSDDKSVSKLDRKKQQILHAPSRSSAAKLVKAADKIHNLSSLMDAPPSIWTMERIQGYFVWSYHVIQALSLSNAILNEQLERLFERTVSYINSEGERVEFPALPPRDQLASALESYYTLIASVDD
jgi:hypothetical protein